MIVILLVFIIYVILIVGLLEIFPKAGQKWWMGLIPIYSNWVLIVKIAKMAPYWFVFNLIIQVMSSLEISSNLQILLYILDFFVSFCICYNIARKFNKDPIVSGLVGGFVSGLLFLYIGLDKKSKYDENVVVSPNGPFNLN